MPDTGAPAREFFFDMKKHLQRDAHIYSFASLTFDICIRQNLMQVPLNYSQFP